MKPDSKRLLKIYRSLHQAYGDQGWWPGDSAFEIMVGAILTQNTNWKNVEKALINLIDRKALDPQSIIDTPPDQLALWLRPSGYFNIKAKRLQNFCRWYLDQGEICTLQSIDSVILRNQLLEISGIGQETADSMLLYAFKRPVFVIDQYTRRLFQRLGIIVGDESYEELRLMVEQELQPDVALFNEFHALIVAHGKEHCRKKPLCNSCVLQAQCAES